MSPKLAQDFSLKRRKERLGKRVFSTDRSPSTVALYSYKLKLPYNLIDQFCFVRILPNLSQSHCAVKPTKLRLTRD